MNQKPWMRSTSGFCALSKRTLPCRSRNRHAGRTFANRMLEKATAARCIGRDQAAHRAARSAEGRARLTAFVSVQVGDHSGKAIARFAAETPRWKKSWSAIAWRATSTTACVSLCPSRGLRYFLQASDRHNSAQERYVAFRLENANPRLPSNCLPEVTARGPGLVSRPVPRCATRLHRGRPAPARKFAKSPRRSLNGQMRSRHCGKG